jgi:acyl-CoA synthetase (AMP-forming)/AMP-acid ligase II
MTWGAMIARWRGCTDTAVIGPEAVWSGDDLVAYGAGAADWLDHIGAPAGEPVPALVTSTPEAFALIVGAAGSARPLAPLGPRHTLRELCACLRSVGAGILVAEPAFTDVANEVAAAMAVRVAVLPELAPSSRRLDFDPPANATAFVLHTSGTSGIPKAVPYRQDRMRRRAEINMRLGSLGPGSAFASASPFHHIAGWGNYAVALAAGATLVPLPRFTVEAWKGLAAHGTTNALVVPTMIEMLLDSGALDIGTIRFLHYGASQIHPDTLARVLNTLPGVGLVNIYGQTEGSPITCLTPDDHRTASAGRADLLASVGRAAPEVELRIEHPDGRDVGEVCARAFHLMKADEDGWLRTGDMGHVDAEGYLYLSGRKGDKIIRGGENVYPQEVEQILREHADVRDCAVVGSPDVKWGETVKAFIVPTDPASPPHPEAVRAWARSQLVGFKVPTEWEFVDDLPRNAAGKVLRTQLIHPPDVKE